MCVCFSLLDLLRLVGETKVHQSARFQSERAPDFSPTKFDSVDFTKLNNHGIKLVIILV